LWDRIAPGTSGTEVSAPDGKSYPFGPTPRGIVIFTPAGDFMQIHIDSEVPKIANGTMPRPRNMPASMRGIIAQFGH
jgi:Lipocalin-like domain